MTGDSMLPSAENDAPHYGTNATTCAHGVSLGDECDRCNPPGECLRTKFPDGTRCGEYDWHALDCPARVIPPGKHLPGGQR